MSFEDYIAHGWRLCAIDPPDERCPPGHPKRGGKAPKSLGWNKPGPQAAIPNGYGAGLMHVESGTCAIDIDQMEVATLWLAQRGVDLASLLNVPSVVRISSGRTGRAKLLFQLDKPLRSVKTAPFKAISPRSGKEETYTALDFRCATRDGLSLQDVLPPTIHPDTGRPYAWEYGDELLGTWRNLPPLPDELRRVWESLLSEQVTNTAPAAPFGAGFDEMRSLLSHQDPNAAYNEWLRVGMALHHETRGARDGLLLWNEWSAQATGAGKYKGIADLEPHWRSFNSNAAGAITLGSLRSDAVADAADFPLVPPSTTPAPQSNTEFRVDDGEDLENAPPLEWIVDAVLPKAATGVVFGPSGAGKSSWVLDFVLHIAAGLPWRSRTVKQQRVLYIAGEGAGGFRGAGGRYGRARRKLGIERPPLHFITNKSPNLFSADDPPKLARLMQTSRDTPVGLVIFDTLAQMTPGADENSAKDMTIALKNCRMIHEATGAMVLLIAHAGKDLDRGIRGSTAIKGDVDVAIEVTERGGGIHVARIDKMRDGESKGEYPFKLEGGVLVHTDEAPRTKAVKYSPGSIESIVRQVYPELSPIGSGLGVHYDTLCNAVLERAFFSGDTPVADREKKVRRGVESYLSNPSNGLIGRNGVIYSRDVAAFDLRPVDTGGSPLQDNADLLGA